MKYLVAVSGGIDSVVLLDMLARADKKHELIVAHFDHGIRSDSADDARFVAGLAEKYGLPFVTKREELGEQASEDLARARRYEFLRDAAKKHDATIVTAHHQDDIIESVAINMIRGTGWRGLAVFGAADIKRPLLRFSKSQIRDYALANRVEWVEDSTNASTVYLRNRVRRVVMARLSDASKQEVVTKWQHQIALKSQIDKELATYVQGSGEYPRYMLIMVDPIVANELLRRMVMAKCSLAPTRPQTDRALVAIKTARPGSTFEIGAGAALHFTTNTFIVAAS